MNYRLRKATADDLPLLHPLIDRSARELSAGDYTARQVDGALRGAFGVDSQLIADGTYFVVERDDGAIIGCGGWSRRRTLFGGDQMKGAEDPLLDPATEPARVRAMFVRGGWTPGSGICGPGSAHGSASPWTVPTPRVPLAWQEAHCSTPAALV